MLRNNNFIVIAGIKQKTGNVWKCNDGDVADFGADSGNGKSYTKLPTSSDVMSI